MDEIEDILTAAQVAVRNAERDLAEAILHRDSLIAQAASLGVTPYRIAKWTGLSAPAVHKALDRFPGIRKDPPPEGGGLIAGQPRMRSADLSPVVA